MMLPFHSEKSVRSAMGHAALRSFWRRASGAHGHMEKSLSGDMETRKTSIPEEIGTYTDRSKNLISSLLDDTTPNDTIKRLLLDDTDRSEKGLYNSFNVTSHLR